MCTVKQGPGKFEGETCITRLMHALAMDGVLDRQDCDCPVAEEWDDTTPFENECSCSPVDVAFGPFTLDDIRQYRNNAPTLTQGNDFCGECTKDFLAANRIEYFEDSQGFAYSEVL